jgi:hypothetical protein
MLASSPHLHVGASGDELPPGICLPEGLRIELEPASGDARQGIARIMGRVDGLEHRSEAVIGTAISDEDPVHRTGVLVQVRKGSTEQQVEPEASPSAEKLSFESSRSWLVCLIWIRTRRPVR